MKFRKIYQILLLLIFTLLVTQCEKKDATLISEIKIGIINPHPGSLYGFQQMVEDKVINIPGLRFVAICYEQYDNKIESVAEYIRNHNDLFELKVISGYLDADSLFVNNKFSDKFAQIFNETDGLFFLGGADYPPNTYKEKTSLLTSILTPDRHYFELSLLFHLIGGYWDLSYIPLLKENPDYPVIGFCLGMQSINGAAGGTMYQDIPSEIYGLKYVEEVLASDKDQQHRNYWQDLEPDDQMIWANFHRIKSAKEHPIFDQSLWEQNVNPLVFSSHHQAVETTGQHIEIIATSMDGKVPEIIVHQKFPNVFGVQFHPEVFSIYSDEGPTYKWQPDDEITISYNDFLNKNNSMDFHRNLWKNISKLFIQ